MQNLERHYLAKIEGHGTLNISFPENKAELHIGEGERLIEQLVIDKKFEDGPFITSRICGVCSIVHQLASVKALEECFGVLLNPTIIKFRKIILAAQIAQSHFLHLFFLALPDYIGLDSSITFSEKEPKTFKSALAFKRSIDDVITIIGGRAIHPLTLKIGGFSKVPDKSSLKKLRSNLKKNFPFSKKLLKMFANFEYPEIRNKTEYLCLDTGSDEYQIYDGKIISNIDSGFEPENYKREITEYLKPYSTAKFSVRNKKVGRIIPKGRAFMVGALARLSNHPEKLLPRTMLEYNELLTDFPTFNPFHNNLAQAVEIMQMIEFIILALDELIERTWDETRVEFEIKKGTGVGVAEAPRGTLYHWYETDKQGRIKNCNIITPTAQNLTNLESDAEVLLKHNMHLTEKQRKKQLEMLIRAYDPCITCSVH